MATTVATTVASAAAVAPTGTGKSALTADALLDSLDVYTSSRATVEAAISSKKHEHPSSSPSSSGDQQQATIVVIPPKMTTDTTATTSAAKSSATSGLDPIEFLNRHYTTESMLVAQLPSLRTATGDRMERLDERISNALQRQSETADSTRRHVQEAKSSIISLEKRIRLVQEKASQSEKAVLEITREMKRLDCAKRHLQRTITTLKRLHMLVHAVEQLRLSCLLKPFPDYKSASNLIDATRLLLKHFDAYTNKVEPMRLMGQKVYDIQNELRIGLIRGYRIVGFGLVKALELEEGKIAGGSSASSAGAGGGSLLPSSMSAANPTSNQSGGGGEQPAQTMPIMTPDVLADATLLLDALGMDTRTDFVNGLCNDHLLPYKQLFDPKPSRQPKPTAPSNSLKFSTSDVSTDSSIGGEKPPFSLEQIDRRFAWYRRLFRDVFEEKFHKVFPSYWNIQYTLTKHFLEQTKEHLLALLGGSTKDRDADNATVLLKALQKTILFEKEMTNWLQRDYGTVFLTAGVSAGDANGGDATAAATTDETQPGAVRGDDGEVLEFDETGRAVAANSAEGIRIKYERQRREKKKQQQQSQQRQESDPTTAAMDEGRASADQVPVEPLVGVASSAYDNYMKPYIALEEQNMNEQLDDSRTNGDVDTRGELPVFTSSTALFVYIKGSITRCTALTKGKAFHLLYKSFQDSLKKYANVLCGKLPKETLPVVGGISSALATRSTSSSSGMVLRIPPGGEVTACHVISTCEYCVDTVEALEDLIRDTIDEEFKEMIDMSEQQDSFHDVTAKSIRVLVSGLANRVENGFKMMSEIKWSSFDMVGDESSYVRLMHKEIQPFVANVRTLMPSSYFRSFCDKFATSFTTTYYDNLIKQKRVSEGGAQQLLLDVNNLKTLILKLPVMEKTSTSSSSGKNKGAVGTIAPAMYTKMVTKQFKKVEILLKLVSTPSDLLVDVFKAHWVGGSALDLQTVMTLKGMKRNEQATMLEKFGLDRATALRGATHGVSSASLMAERAQSITEKSSGAVAKVNSDLNQMRQKVDDFRRAFR